MAEPFKNRRKHVRIYRNFILTCYLKSSPSNVFQMSQVNNISQGGLNFSSTFSFPMGSDIIIDLKTPFLNDNVTLEGIVLESRDKIPGLIFGVRVEFKNISPQAQDILIKIEQYSAQQE